MSKIDGGVYAEFKKHLKGFHFQRIETGLTGGGVPDVNYCFDGVEGWIENKKTDGWKVTIRPDQCGWISRRVRMGGRVYVAIRRKKSTIDELWLVNGSSIKILTEHTLQIVLRSTNERVQFGSGGPTKWDWDAVRRTLLR